MMKRFIPLLAVLFLATCRPPKDPPIRTIDRPGFTLDYYSTWHIDTLHEDYDIDGYFFIDSPGDGLISFTFYNVPMDESELIELAIEEYSGYQMKNPDVSYFDTWAGYKGHGAILKGKILGVLKGEVQIFASSTDEEAFMVVKQFYESDRARYNRGVSLIESSFEMR